MKWYEATAIGVVLYLLYRGARTGMNMSDPQAKKEILDAFEARGFARDEASKTIQIESGWRPSARNKASGAVGLIQFMPADLRGLGWSAPAADFAELSMAEQLPWIKRFLKRAPPGSRPGDAYLLVAAPSYIGMPDDVVVYPVGSKAWKMNPPWHDPGEPVTAGSLRRVVLSRM